MYFLRGVAIQAGDFVSRIQRIDDHLSPLSLELARGGSPLHRMALDLFNENPYWSVGGLVERLDVAFSTARRTVGYLDPLGIVSSLRSITSTARLKK